ncbi:DUF3157 family protein [Carboxylicivirga marina]|uniref:DUF4468 domain-containing protein n=1 Tax=Carboxylicivirga marina TaxID=2800988 RepID=A0ABS1HP15_9BACT|nr:DUF3157 family protein [Carboxylicivirga marina]MBK3519326.1 hypothetical protein [Carboxylicivirga marina]
MKNIVFLLTLLTASIATNAQTVKAITQHGETVVLYENGTWKYEKDVQNNATEAVSSSTTPSAPPVVAVAAIEIDANKEATSEKVELCNAVSKKLSRFFGEEKGRVRCSVSATNSKGEISLNFEFMMQIGDANRYFGYSAADRTMKVELSDGSNIQTTFTDNIEEKFIDKWGVSYYKASVKLSQEDAIKLYQNNAIRMVIDWKKLEEEYQIETIDGFKTVLSEVL